jgi:formiminoglutamase
MLSQFLDMPDLAYISDEKNYHQFEVGHHVKFLEDDVYDFSPYDIAVLGVKEARAAGFKNLSCDMAPDEIRKDFYRLNIPNPMPRIIDLGNIRDAEEVSESYDYLETVLNFLYKNEITVVILGGSQDLTTSQFAAFGSITDNVNMTIVDERIDLQKSQETISSDGFIQHIMASSHPQLYHMSLFGYQSYFTNYNILDVVDSMSYEAIRLGQVRYSVPQWNHIFRMSDMVSIDISAVKQSDAPGRSLQSPNGFQSDELCQITRICGMCPQIKSIGIYEVNPQFDIRHLTTQMVAHSLWYFLEGFTYRTDESPEILDQFDNFIVYMVEHSEFGSKPFHYWFSKLTGQWWVEIPLPDSSRFFPCSKADYDSSANGELSKWVFNLVAKTQ